MKICYTMIHVYILYRLLHKVSIKDLRPFTSCYGKVPDQDMYVHYKDLRSKVEDFHIQYSSWLLNKLLFTNDEA